MTYRILSGSIADRPDTRELLQSFERLAADSGLWFDVGKEIVLTRAPGRLDVMGGIADYSGSLVLQLPITDATHVLLQKTSAPVLQVSSVSSSNGGIARTFEMDLKEFWSNTGIPIEYQVARQKFASRRDHWAAYVAGVFLVLSREKGVRFDAGARLLISSSVPEGKGVSSSAALEVAVMQAVNAAYDLELNAREIALLCQKVENLIAGAPCGIMDQLSAVSGQTGSLLKLLCQPAQLFGSIPLPEEFRLWGIDSGVRHSVGGSDYGTIRTAAFMGYRIISRVAGLNSYSSETPGKVIVEDPRWSGYLANVSVKEFEEEFATAIPEMLSGYEFLEQFEGITDNVTSVQDDVDYPILVATRHPIYEHDRVRAFAEGLGKGKVNGNLLGQLMFESHQSYSDCGLGSEATDMIVSLIKELENDQLYGGRITGGGSGGTVAVLGSRDAEPAINKLVERFQEATGYAPLVISGSSPGAETFGALRLRSE